MLEHYRRTFVWSQLLVLALAAAAHYVLRWPAVAVFGLFVVLQGTNVMGAWWGARLKRQIAEQNGEALPLSRDR
ncbi:MAG TPA: hypothetical protein VK324_08105 [Tepidisphaeraceae bacterium]|nr:hypothetical protein [Tepidisphaeraceae bacterium]